jgi:hypothetical protein
MTVATNAATNTGLDDQPPAPGPDPDPGPSGTNAGSNDTDFVGKLAKGK